MPLLSISTDLDCFIENAPNTPNLLCGNNLIFIQSIGNILFRSIEFPDLYINKTISEQDINISLDFSKLIRAKNLLMKNYVKISTPCPFQLFGILNIKTNQIILPPEYLQIGDIGLFSLDREYIIVRDANSFKYGIFSINGDEIFPIQFDEINSITEDGYTVVKTKRGKTFININERIVFPVRENYYSGFSFNDGLLEVSENNKRGYINHYGQSIFNPIFDNYINDINSGFSNGYAWERINGKWGIIDSYGNITCDFKFDKPGSRFDINKISCITLDNKLYFVSPNGNLEERDGSFGFYGNESVYIIRKNSGWGFQNLKGENLYFEPIFDSIVPFKEGISLVKYLGRNGMVLKTGRYIDLSELNIKEIYNFDSGRSKIITHYGTCGYINEKGEIAINPEYDDFGSTSFLHGIAKVETKPAPFSHRRDGFYIDIYGNELCKYFV